MKLLTTNKRQLKNFIKNNGIFIVEIMITVLLCIVHALVMGHNANFAPTNGTFQNYNPVRRLLSGQIPYRDFQDYLGLGHLYIGSLATVLFGGNFRSSRVAFSFLSFGGLAAISYMVSLALFKKKEKSAAITNIILVLLLIKPLILINAVAGTEDILNALTYALGAGNSARFVRGLILPIVVFLIWLGYSAYMKIAETHEKILNYKDWVISIGIGLIAGFAFAWSNDYGISCWVCLFIMTLWVSICRSRKILKSILYAGVELVTSFAGVFVVVVIFTAGHFSEWFGATFGTGGYQGWYYNSPKSYYLYDVDFSYIMLIQAGISIVYLIKLFMKYRLGGGELWRYGILAFANMVCFCAVNEYKMLSGGESREVALSVLFFTVLYGFIRLYDNHREYNSRGQAVIVVSVVVCLAWIIAQSKEEFIFKFLTDKDGVWVDALGGNLTSLGDELLMTEEFLDGENFFATYASAQEIVNGSFQPSGIDYIIHVLGDQQRRDYFDSFKKGDFKYAATLNETYTSWEYWVQRANWFFYRELYENWHPVYANSYEVFWQRNAGDDEYVITDGYDIEIEDVNEYFKRIKIRCCDELNGIADVYIDADVDLKGGLSSKLVFNKMLLVENTGTIYAQDAYYELNYLRPDVKEYIPIPIINGYGELSLSSEPRRNTTLILNSVSCDRIFTVTADFVWLTDIDTDDNGRVIFYVANTDKNKNALVNIRSVEFLGKQYAISEIEEDDDSLYIITGEIMDAPSVEAGRENYLILRR